MSRKSEETIQPVSIIVPPLDLSAQNMQHPPIDNMNMSVLNQYETVLQLMNSEI